MHDVRSRPWRSWTVGLGGEPPSSQTRNSEWKAPHAALMGFEGVAPGALRKHSTQQAGARPVPARPGANQWTSEVHHVHPQRKRPCRGNACNPPAPLCTLVCKPPPPPPTPTLTHNTTTNTPTPAHAHAPVHTGARMQARTHAHPRAHACLRASRSPGGSRGRGGPQTAWPRARGSAQGSAKEGSVSGGAHVGACELRAGEGLTGTEGRGGAHPVPTGVHGWACNRSRTAAAADA